MNTAQTDFLGTGWGFPPAFSKGGEDVVMVSREEDIMQSLLILLGTSLDERAMREDYGCNLQDYLFEELDTRLLNYLRNAITESIRIHEPRINLEDVNFDIQADYTQSLINIEIQFLVRSTNSRYNMVYPFYLTEGAMGVGVPSLPSGAAAPALPFSFNMEDYTGEQFEALLHRPTSASTNNWSANYSMLDHLLLNENPDAICFVTSLWGIENEGGPTVDAFEVGYLPTEKRWAIFSKNPGYRMRHQNGTPNFFYVLIAPKKAIQGKYAFVHQASADNIRLNATLIENKHSDLTPNAYLMVTPRRSAHTNHEICVTYFADGHNKWAIANSVSDGNASGIPENQMVAGAEFNVLVLPKKELGNLRAFSHQASGNNIKDNVTYIDNELVNGHQSAFLFFTQAWRPEYTTAQGNHCPYHCQLWFDSATDAYRNWQDDRWFIWAPMGSIPQVTVFNVFVLQNS